MNYVKTLVALVFGTLVLTSVGKRAKRPKPVPSSSNENKLYDLYVYLQGSIATTMLLGGGHVDVEYVESNVAGATTLIVVSIECKQCCATIGITEHATGSFDVHVASTVLHEHMNTLRLKSSKDVDKLVWECYDDLVTFAHKYPEPGVY